MKTIKLVIEDDKKGVVVIPITKRDMHNIYDFGFMVPQDKCEFMETLKLNKCDDTFWKLHKIAAKTIDALSEGKCYQFKDNKCVVSKYKFYHSNRKPIWRKK